RALGDYELASRLSYFLWGTMPDEELFEAAKKGILRRPEELERQTRRMLRHRKVKSLSENFAIQWLGLSGIDRLAPDPTLFPAFYACFFKQFLRQEVYFLFEAVLLEDRSILEFVDADFVIVTGPLARLYGLPFPRDDGYEG